MRSSWPVYPCGLRNSARAHKNWGEIPHGKKFEPFFAVFALKRAISGNGLGGVPFSPLLAESGDL